MPQNPLAATVAVNASGVQKPFLVDAGNRQVTVPSTSSRLNVTAATVVKASAGFVSSVNVIVAGSAPGTLNDCLTTGAAAAANQIAVLPNTVGSYELAFPAATGIVVVPGTGQTIAISYV